MGIYMTGGVIANRTEEDSTGAFHIIEPMASLMASPESRVKMQQEGINVVRISVDPHIAVVVLLGGGYSGQEFTVAITVRFPTGRSATVLESRLTWGDADGHRVISYPKGYVEFTGTKAPAEFSAFVDGELVGTLRLPLRWADDPP